MKTTVRSILADVTNDIKMARARASNARKQKEAIALALKLTKNIASNADDFMGWVTANSYDDNARLHLVATVRTENMKSVRVGHILGMAENMNWENEDSKDYAWETGAERQFRYNTKIANLSVCLEVSVRIKADGEACRVEQVGVEVQEKPIYAIRCA